MEQKQTQRFLRPGLWLPREQSFGDGWIGRLGSTGTHYHMQNLSVTRTYWVAREVYSILWDSLHGERIRKKVDILCICLADSLCCVPETNAALQVTYTPIKFI